MVIKCYLMQFCMPRTLPCVGLPFLFAEEDTFFSMEIDRCSEALSKLNLSCLASCSHTLLKLSWHDDEPRDVPFLEMLILIPAALVQTT